MADTTHELTEHVDDRHPEQWIQLAYPVGGLEICGLRHYFDFYRNHELGKINQSLLIRLWPSS